MTLGGKQPSLRQPGKPEACVTKVLRAAFCFVIISVYVLLASDFCLRSVLFSKVTSVSSASLLFQALDLAQIPPEQMLRIRKLPQFYQ